MPARPTFRFAPSPTGRLHLGHAYSAILNHELARRMGGRFILRIEDIDCERCREENVTGILEDLAWLGLDWEQPVRRQSEHFDVFRAAWARLEATGLLYPCFATRKEIDRAAAAQPGHARDPDGSPLYPGLWRGASATSVAARLAAGDKPALRLDMAKALHVARNRGIDLVYPTFTPGGADGLVVARPEHWGDAVIVRKEAPSSYHLSVVVDDALQGITHIVRGRDLEAATDLHRLLQVLLDLPLPYYHHHGLIPDPSGLKLSKSLNDQSLASLRAAGVTPLQLRERIGSTGGLSFG